MNYSNKYTIFMILMCFLEGTSCIESSDLVSTEKIYEAKEINVRTLRYAKIPKEDYVELWESEFKLGRSLSNLKEFLEDRLNHTPNEKFKENIETDVHLYADIYSPPSKYNAPLIVLLHGGAFVKGKRDSEYMKTLSMEFAQRGYKVASIDYRKMTLLNPSLLKTAYLAMQDVHMALDFFIMNADSLKIDNDNIFLGGISAGALTAINVAYFDADEDILDRKDKLENLYGAVDYKNPEIKPNIKAVINIAGGVFDLEILDNKISCISYHGTNDNIIRMDYNYPFVQETNNYNSILSKLQNLFLDYPSIAKRLEDAEMVRIYGSRAIHEKLRADSTLYAPLKIMEGEDHYFMFSRNETLTNTGIEVIDDLARKLDLLVSEN